MAIEPVTRLAEPDLTPLDASIPLPSSARPWTTFQLALTGCIFGIAALLALSFDLHLSLFLKHHRPFGDLQRLLRLAEVFGFGGSVALIILTAAVLDPRGWIIVPRLIVGAFLPGFAADAIKLLVARMRPIAADLTGDVQSTFVCWLPLSVNNSQCLEYGYKCQSFPSGHSATAAGLAIALAALYPRGRWLFVVFAALACLQRLDAQAHFASDILAAAALACFIGAILEFKARRP